MAGEDTRKKGKTPSRLRRKKWGLSSRPEAATSAVEENRLVVQKSRQPGKSQASQGGQAAESKIERRKDFFSIRCCLRDV